MSTIKVNTITKRTGSTLTLGESGATVAIACGATTSGMGRTGTVDWCSTIYTNSPGTITGVNGKGYFINTTSGTVTVTLPSSPSAGDIIVIKDYARTFGTNAVTINRNGSKMCGSCACTTVGTNGTSATLIYADNTRGWMFINEDATSQAGTSYVTATGGTITTSGDYKIHTFTSSSNFVVTCAGNATGSDKVSYVVVAAGGGGAGNQGNADGSSGGGAGGYREGKCSADPYTASPLAATPCSGIAVPAATYPITIGAGGAGGPDAAGGHGSKGNNSIFSSITSTGGGGGQHPSPPYAPISKDGGSGAGAAASGNPNANQIGAGNTPPVSPPQGNNGGNYSSSGASAAGGGGGAGAVGGNAPGNTVAGNGGDGVTSSINASAIARAGGGGGSAYPGNTGGSGGAGGGGDGGKAPGTPSPSGQPGTANTGGGGGATNATPGTAAAGGTGGSGVVIIRYKFQN